MFDKRLDLIYPVFTVVYSIKMDKSIEKMINNFHIYQIKYLNSM